ncbi:MAG: DMT family transporter [Rhodoferax sp.]|nr:DMT family transporter [Rhodoferax sp.]
MFFLPLPVPSLSRPSMASGLAMALLGAVAFSGKAIIVKLAYRHGVDTITFLMLRMLLALPFFVVMAWWSGRARGDRAPPALSRRDVLGVVWLGFTGYYLASFLDFAGLAYISASFERLVLYLNPTLVLILGALLYGRRISRFQWAGLAISYGGVVLVFGHEVQLVGEDVWLGAGLVFASAVSYALYLSYSGELVRRLGALRLVGLASCVACVFCIGQFVLLRPVSGLLVLDASVWWLSVVNATACTVVPVVLVMMAIERLGAGLAAQVGMVGPMSTLAMAALFLDEPLTPWVLGGTVLVMGGVFVCTRSNAPASGHNNQLKE